MEDRISERLGLTTDQVTGALSLLDEGNTVPFIARYRKEQTGGLDEVQIRDVASEAESIRELENRRQTVLETIEDQDKLTDELREKIETASTKSKLDDLYAPYRPRQMTRATRAREAGLEPVAEVIETGNNPKDIADQYTSDEYETVEDVLQGARDILAEAMSDDPNVRGFLRKKAQEDGRLTCSKRRGADGDPKYETYHDVSVPIDRVKPHQVLAIRRGENEKELSASLSLDDDQLKKRIANHLIDTDGVAAQHHYDAIKDGYDRLLHPAIERDLRGDLEDRADEHAIENFSVNLKNLLLQPPMPDTVILGIDPGQRTGCKLAVIGTNGELLETGQCYVHDQRRDEAVEIIRETVDEFDTDLVAIGNGTAGRETEKVVGEALEDGGNVQYAIVDEAGASVYSASELAREEFPDLDVSYRGAVSIARRLQDPLAELVKIDPQSIGVGMYQHDVNQNDLEDALNAVIEDVVNSVGVDLNSASAPLLSRVAGIGPALAERIVNHRENHGSFNTRRELKDVNGMGAKTYRQCAGFLRIRDGEDPLDNTGIHPENYEVARRILDEIDADPGDPDLSGKLDDLRESGRLATIGDEHDVGDMTLTDLLEALQAPGRDPRDQLDPPDLRTDVLSMEDLKEDMQLQGTVRNVVDFGAFVDIGVKNDGLLHVSEMADRYVDNPHEEVSVGDQVTVSVQNVDPDQGKIALGRG
jgi:uncharacterized protein